MAWTQAARDAAALTRKAHAAAKGPGREQALRASPLDKQVLLARRPQLAANVKALRGGGAQRQRLIKMGYTSAGLMSEVRASTALRNMGKSSKKKR